MAMRQPYEDSLAAREIVPELRSINANLDEGFTGVNAKLASIDAKLDAGFASVDTRLNRIDARLEAIQNDLHAGFTTMASLLTEIRDRLPPKEWFGRDMGPPATGAVGGGLVRRQGAP